METSQLVQTLTTKFLEQLLAISSGLPHEVFLSAFKHFWLYHTREFCNFIFFVCAPLTGLKWVVGVTYSNSMHQSEWWSVWIKAVGWSNRNNTVMMREIRWTATFIIAYLITNIWWNPQLLKNIIVLLFTIHSLQMFTVIYNQIRHVMPLVFLLVSSKFSLK